MTSTRLCSTNHNLVTQDALVNNLNVIYLYTHSSDFPVSKHFTYNREWETEARGDYTQLTRVATNCIIIRCKYILK